jgi:hypothetical protein
MTALAELDLPAHACNGLAELLGLVYILSQQVQYQPQRRFLSNTRQLGKLGHGIL